MLNYIILIHPIFIHISLMTIIHININHYN